MNAIRTARETTDRAKRADRYERAITTLLEERVHIPAFTLDNNFGVKSRARNFDPHAIASVNPRLIGVGSVSRET
jgi:peptide/nickel transport system substrate-binding protein